MAKLHSEYYEKLALSAMIHAKGSNINEMLSLGLSEKLFYFKDFRKIYNEIIKRRSQGFIDEQGLQEHLITTGVIKTDIKKAGGIGIDVWLEITGAFLHGQQIKESVTALTKFQIIRNIQTTVSIMQETIDSGVSTPEGLILDMNRSIEDNRKLLMSDSSVKTAAQAAQEFENFIVETADGKSMKAVTKTNIRAIDNINGGLRNGDLVVISAETSGGKSALALQMVGAALRQRKSCMVFSLEMTADIVMARLCTHLRQIPLGKITNASQLNKEDLLKIKEWISKIKTHANLFIDDEADITVEQIIAKAKKQHEKEPLEMVLVDYIQLVTPTKGVKNREQEVSEISRKLKGLAKTLNVPVLALSQLNDDGKMRESRAIANDSDILLKIIPGKGIAVVKYRSAERGQILPVIFDGPYQTFRDALVARPQALPF